MLLGGRVTVPRSTCRNFSNCSTVGPEIVSQILWGRPWDLGRNIKNTLAGVCECVLKTFACFFDTRKYFLFLFVCSRPVVALLLGSTTHGWTGPAVLKTANWRASHTTKREVTPYYESSFILHWDSAPVVNAARSTFSLMELNAHSQLLFKLGFTGETTTDGTLLRLKWVGFAARHRVVNFWKETFKFPFMFSNVALHVVMHTQDRAHHFMLSLVTFLLKSTASKFVFPHSIFIFSFVSMSHFSDLSFFHRVKWSFGTHSYLRVIRILSRGMLSKTEYQGYIKSKCCKRYSLI